MVITVLLVQLFCVSFSNQVTEFIFLYLIAGGVKLVNTLVIHVPSLPSSSFFQVVLQGLFRKYVTKRC